MTLRHYVSAKIHNIRVTAKSVEYHGSIAVCPALLKAANIEPFERVDVINLNNGERWTTYAIEGRDAELSLNGGGARLGELDDRCVIIAYAMRESFKPADVVYCGEGNRISTTFQYEHKR